MTVNVDIASLASIVCEVETTRALKMCIEFSKILQYGSTVSVVMTWQSWEATSGGGGNRVIDMLEQVLERQAVLESNMTSMTHHTDSRDKHGPYQSCIVEV